MIRRLVCILAVVLLLLPVSALAFTIDLYETVDNTPNGIPSETGPVVTLPSDVVAGTVFIWEGQTDDRSVLSDMLLFYPSNYPNTPFASTGNTVQLFSDFIRQDINTLAGLPTAEVFEGNFRTLPIIYTAGDNIYRIWSDLPGTPENTVPLPPSLVLLGTGFIGMVGWRALRRQ